MKKIVFIFLSIFSSIILLEFLSRFVGVSPWQYAESDNPIIYESDESLGWKAKEGSYLINLKSSPKSKMRISIGEKGNRLSGRANLNPKNPSIIFIGGSFTQGWGINDQDTFASKIQDYYKDFYVYNFAQAGYGGVQSLATLDQQIKQIKQTKLVVYGFIEHHEYRNVARSSWLATLSKYSRRGYSENPKIPYATIDENDNLKIYPPISYLHLPLREKSAIITLIEKVYMKQISRKRKEFQKPVTKRIILEMSEISKKNDSEFLVVILDWSNNFSNNEYKNYLKSKNINYVDCKISLNEATLVPGDYHPNGKGHSLYKDCINSFIIEKNLLF